MRLKGGGENKLKITRKGRQVINRNRLKTITSQEKSTDRNELYKYTALQHVINVVVLFLLGNYPASEFKLPMKTNQTVFRNVGT